MFTKIYDKIKNFIKENYKTLILFSILYFIVLFPLDYYIITGGGIIDVNDRVKIKNSYKGKGSLNMAYVSELKGTIFTYGLSYIIPSWERNSMDNYRVEDESVKDIEFRDDLSMSVSNENAIKQAYKLAGKNFKITDSHLYVILVSDTNKDKIKVGDEILEVKGTEVSSFEKLKEIINSCNDKEKISIKLKRKNKVIEEEVEVYKEKGELLLGIVVEKLDDYKTDPKIELKFTKAESGPSGGLLLALDIYNKLTKKDITGGLKIVGTGTMESDGSIGEIGGVEYKLIGAVNGHADIFIAPAGNNYKEAVKYAKKKNYDIKIIEADNFENVIKKLEEITKKK